MARRSLGSNYRKLFAATTISNLGDGVGADRLPVAGAAVTRNPLLIALVAVVQRLPWLLFTLPAGVITDRHDRRRLMVGANTIRSVLTVVVAFAVLARGRASAGAGRGRLGRRHRVVPVRSCCSSPRCCSGRARCSTTTAPRRSCRRSSTTRDLEQANGQMYSAEMVANQFAGPPLASLLLRDRVRAADHLRRRRRSPLSAGLVFASWPRSGAPEPRPAPASSAAPFKQELAEGFRWLWRPPACCARSPSPSASSTCSATGLPRRHRAVRPGGAQHVDVRVRPAVDGVRRRRRASAGGRRRRDLPAHRLRRSRCG